MEHIQTKHIRRTVRTRAKISHFSDRVRLAVFRSNKHIYAQLIDKSGKTLTSVSDKDLKEKLSKTAAALEVGKLIGEKANKKGIQTVVFDRGGYQYHGRVKAIATGARESKLVI
jgi:large subunit ribosomal protein L18